MTCPTCKDVRWVPNLKKGSRWKGPCPGCNDNGQRKVDDPDPTLAAIVAALPEGHAAKGEYTDLLTASNMLNSLFDAEALKKRTGGV